MGASLSLWGLLPAAYQPEYFDLWVPPLLGLSETALKLTAVVISTFLVAGLSQPRQRLGLGVYVCGVAIYLGSYFAQIFAPDSAWSQSFLGFTAPAFTPAIWIVGIGLMISHGFIVAARWPRIIFWVSAAGFMITHNINASLVYLALSGGS